MSAKVVSCSNINGYLRNYQDCLTLVVIKKFIFEIRNVPSWEISGFLVPVTKFIMQSC
jgi:hypothetical protein